MIDSTYFRDIVGYLENILIDIHLILKPDLPEKRKQMQTDVCFVFVQRNFTSRNVSVIFKF
jgi:hypothetical protein